MRTPEPTTETDASKSNSGFIRLLIQMLNDGLVMPGLFPGRLIVIDSPHLRRKIRGYCSGQSEITDYGFVVAGVASLDPQRLLVSEFIKSDNHRLLARLKRTWSNTESRKIWAVMQTTRMMATVEAVAGRFGWNSAWITEGIDQDEIQNLLAIPADHLLIGLLAVDSAETKFRAGDCGTDIPIFLDKDGFYGQWPKSADMNDT